MDKRTDKKEFIKDVLITVGIAFIVLSFIRPVVVKGESMEPAFHENDYLVVIKTESLKRGDIAVLKENGGYIIKRVIGIEGDEISFENKKVYCNGEEWGKGDGESLIVTGYYVMGDNRDNSYDSRMFGCVGRSRILGKVVCRIFPHPQNFLGQIH